MQRFIRKGNYAKYLRKIFGQYSCPSRGTTSRGSERTVSMDNFFAGVPLAKKLIQHQLAAVGTMRKSKQEIRQCMKPVKSRQTKTSVFGFNDRITMVLRRITL